MKREKRQWGIICLILLLIILITFYKKDEVTPTINQTKKTQKEIYIEELSSKGLNQEFLSWLSSNYDTKSLESLSKIDSMNIERNPEWHNVTGYSYYVLNDLYQEKYNTMDNVKVINEGNNIISFVGDVSLADNWYIMPKYDERGKKIYGILSEDIVKIMTESDFMIANNEFTISNRGEKMPGKVYTFRASPNRLSIYQEMGVDLVTLANNHVYDFGKEAFYDMLNSLKENNIPYIGAGQNIEEAKKEYYLILNGYKIAFVNATRAEKIILTPEATNEEGGVFRCYDPYPLIETIKKVKKNSDYVITLIHWGKEDSHELEEVQKETSKMYIEAGTDAIIGSHAHVLQGIEFYQHKPIIYNLGDFIFNNESKDTGIFQMKLLDNGVFEYHFIPAYESSEYTKLLTGSEKERVLQNIVSWSDKIKIDENGKITEN